MIVLVGESASGKSSIEKELVKTGKLKKIVSYTTRPPRQGEVDGIDYYFISEEEFKKLQSENFFVEVGCYRGWYYGSAFRDCGDNAIAVLTPHGLRQMKRIKELNIISFYINVPRRDRLIKILQRGDNIEESYRRNLTDVGLFDGIEDEVDYIMYNEGYEETAEETAEKILKLLEIEKRATWEAV